MKYMTSSEIRNTFLKFFEEKGHLIIPSSSLIPDSDPSLLWINAGVAPLKKYFDGRSKPPKNMLASSQKCIRTNDIENVGKTARHHTFFEMLGNFSIGAYFRDEALEYSWELLTSDKYFGLDKDKLYVTVYPDDKDSIEKWISLGLDKSHIIKCKDNFWDIGPGPCGPDSEIFYDRGEKFDKRGPELIENDIENDRYIEIWNNVFSQFNHIDGLDRKDFPELPHKNIDTGMGLERLTCVIQNGKTNYDTDLFIPIIKEIEKISGKKYDESIYFKAIADHVKTLVFALCDGASFSNEGRGYVLRRILRRALRFGKKLGIEKPFIYKLTDSVIEIMKDAYPNLGDNKSLIDSLIKKEEETFIKTLSSGEKKLNELLESGNEITGYDVFKLYDTYGFPFELTIEILEEKNISFNKEEFDLYMKKQKELARNASSKVSGMNTLGDIVDFKEESIFIGYDKLSCTSKVIFIGDDTGNSSDIYSSGILILDKTPFYATSGGQEGDIGYITNDKFKAEVLDTVKAPNGQHMHKIRILSGKIKTGDKVCCEVDKINRYNTCKNHSATHLLQKSLQEVLGDEVHQKGSFVNNVILRFDFSYSGKINDKDIIEVENRVNEKVEKANNSIIKEMGIEEAKKLGAMALFTEKYGDLVRVVKLGDSVELCGGTHVKNTKDINLFAIKSIESKGTGIFRIEAVCDTNLEKEVFEVIKPYNDDMILLLKRAKKIVKEAGLNGIKLDFDVNISNEKPICYKDILENKEEVLMVKKKVSDLEKKYNEEKSKKLIADKDKFLSEKEKGKYGDVLILNLENTDSNAIKQLSGILLNELNNGIVFISNVNGDSVSFVAKADISLKDKVHIGELIKDISKICSGNGFGSPSFAQGGGSDSSKLNMAINYLKQEII